MEVQSVDFTYDTILLLYQNFFDNELQLDQWIIALKVLAVAFFLLNIYTNMFSKIGNVYGQAKLPFDQNKLLSSLFIVLAIVFYDKLLGFLDTILIGLDSAYSHFSPFDFVPPDKEIDGEDIDFDVWAMLKEMAVESVKIMNDPRHLLVVLIERIAWMVDIAIYVVFLLERFFFIGLLKVLGAIAIALAVFEKGRDLFIKWLKIYISVYLLIIPFFLVIGFTTSIFEYFDKLVGFGNIVNSVAGSSIRAWILVIMIWLKLRLFKKSYDMVYKVFV